jgi:hypothetical protein
MLKWTPRIVGDAEWGSQRLIRLCP